MNENQLRQKFFYGMQEAGMYDATIEWVAPYYREMHSMMLRLATDSLHDCGLNDACVLALDVGCGTGMEAIPLMQATAGLKMVGVDLCEPMCGEFRKAAEAKTIDASRYRLISGDILDAGIADKIKEQASALCDSTSFNIIISAFTLHHLTTDQKLTAFKLIQSLLANDGVFIMGDLFNFGGLGDESPWLTNRVFQWETSWIANNFEAAARAADESGDSAASLRYRSLERAWLQHYNRDNQLESISSHINLLKQAGFTQVGNPFRYWQVGLLWARK